MAYKSGFVAIVGRPNVGKSTFLNKALGQKIVITSDKPQTTRKRIRGIYTTEEGQIIFVDTPGIYKPLHKLGEFLMEEAKLAVPDADLILFFVDVTEKAGPGDKWIVENILKNSQVPVLMVANKADAIKSLEKRDQNIETYKELFGGEAVPILKISAMTGRNLDDLIKNIYRKLPDGPKYYDEDELTDQNQRTIAEEVIREKILLHTQEEIPHSVAVKVMAFKEEEKITRISAEVYVERDSQKGIIIGKGGMMLKQVGTEARVELEDMLEKKVFLELFVKVKKDWRKKEANLKNFGYSQE